MMQHKFLLFSAFCCCLLQVYAVLPPSAMFRPKFLQQSSFSSTSTSDVTSGDDLIEKLNQLSQSQPSVESVTANAETSSVTPPSQPESAPAPEAPTEPTAEEPSDEKSPSTESPSPSKKKLSKSASKKKASPNDPLNIANLDELKERSKEVIRDMLRNENANRALTLLVTSARDLLENKVASNVILTHTHLIKDTLMNEEAKDIIKSVRMDILSTFINAETPEKVTLAMEKSRQCLAREELPEILRKRFKILKKILKNNKTYSAMVSVRNAIIQFVKTPDIKTRIAEQFKLLDFGIHFDPNNVMKSLGLPVSFFK